MPRIKKEKFQHIVNALKAEFPQTFTLHSVEVNRLGAKVIVSGMEGFGYVVGYRKGLVGMLTIAYFPQSTNFVGSSKIPGCFTTDVFEEV